MNLLDRSMESRHGQVLSRLDSGCAGDRAGDPLFRLQLTPGAAVPMAWFSLRSRQSQLGGSPRQATTLPLDLDVDKSVASDQTWLNSTIELRTGLTVIEHPFDTLPGELQEALVAARSESKRQR
jgi:hypothetical protein